MPSHGLQHWQKASRPGHLLPSTWVMHECTLISLMDKNWISVDVWIRLVFPDPVTYDRKYVVGNYCSVFTEQ